QYCTASQIEGSPNASPAWIVKWKFSRFRNWNASRCLLGGQPASAPAMSKPTTPSSRCRTASSAISIGGDPAQRVGRLHDRDRVPERVQVDLQVTAVRALGEALGQLLGVAAGQVFVPDITGELEDGPRAQAAVQVIVQQDLRHGPDLGKCRHPLIVLRRVISRVVS